MISNPLTLVMNIKSETDRLELEKLLTGLQSLPPEHNPIAVALNSLSMVHFARFVFLNEAQLAVITTYDGNFTDYIDAFVNKIGPVFDKLLVHMKDAPPLPVSENRGEFLDYVLKNDIKPVGSLFSAYPDLGVLDILTLQNEAQKRSE